MYALRSLVLVALAVATSGASGCDAEAYVADGAQSISVSDRCYDRFGCAPPYAIDSVVSNGETYVIDITESGSPRPQLYIEIDGAPSVNVNDPDVLLLTYSFDLKETGTRHAQLRIFSRQFGWPDHFALFTPTDLGNGWTHYELALDPKRLRDSPTSPYRLGSAPPGIHLSFADVEIDNLRFSVVRKSN